MSKGPFAIALHGGAGTINPDELTPDIEHAYTTALFEALKAGSEILTLGGSSIDAVEATVISLENCPLFNAGKGAVFTHEKTHELDACIINGSNLNMGAVAAVKGIKNPISLAKSVMNHTEHVLLIGEGAQAFARNQGFEILDDSYFFTEHRYRQLLQIIDSEKTALDHSLSSNTKMGTVGAVALDRSGNLAAATSTGGMTNKRFGRVGDSPIAGAGTYANNSTCAVSCTGHGEFFIKHVVAYDVHALMKYKNLSLHDAAHEVVIEKLKSAGGEGGLVAVDSKGNISMPFNSTGMYRASIKEGQKPFTAIF